MNVSETEKSRYDDIMQQILDEFEKENDPILDYRIERESVGDISTTRFVVYTKRKTEKAAEELMYFKMLKDMIE